MKFILIIIGMVALAAALPRDLERRSSIGEDLVRLIPDPNDPTVAAFLHCSVCSAMSRNLEVFLPRIRSMTSDLDDIQDEVDRTCEDSHQDFGLVLHTEEATGKRSVWPEYVYEDRASIKDGWANEHFKRLCMDVMSKLDRKSIKKIADLEIELGEERPRGVVRRMLCGACQTFGEARKKEEEAALKRQRQQGRQSDEKNREL